MHSLKVQTTRSATNETYLDNSNIKSVSDTEDPYPSDEGMADTLPETTESDAHVVPLSIDEEVVDDSEAGMTLPLKVAVLFCITNPTFSVLYCYDALGAVGPHIIEGNLTSTSEFSSLLSVYAILPPLLVCGTGIIIDVIGLFPAAMFSSFFMVCGNALLMSAFIVNKFWMMLLGRLVMGFGEGVFVVCIAIISTLFKKNVALYTNLTLACGQLGTLLTFIIGPRLLKSYNLVAALSFPVGSTLLSFISLLLFFLLDRYKLNNATKRTQVENLTPKDIKLLPLSYWLIVVATNSTTVAFLVSLSFNPLYLNEWWDYEETEAGYINSTAIAFQLFIPFVGWFMERHKEAFYNIWIIASGLMGVLYLLLAFRVPHPIAWILLISLCFTFINGSMLALIPNLVEEKILGTAIGICMFWLNIAYFVFPEVVGQIRATTTGGWVGYSFLGGFCFVGACASIGIKLLLTENYTEPPPVLAPAPAPAPAPPVATTE